MLDETVKNTNNNKTQEWNMHINKWIQLKYIYENYHTGMNCKERWGTFIH